MLPNPPPTPPNSSTRSTVFPDAGFVYGRSGGYMGTFYNDKYANEHNSNPYFPFQSKGEWELASFLSGSGLSMKHIDEFLSLSIVRICFYQIYPGVLITAQISSLGLSFRCARTLRGQIELLPGGPPWKSTTVSLPGYSTKDPLTLFYRDPFESIESILKNPLFSNQIQYAPRVEYDEIGRRRYGEWVTSDGVWDAQVHFWT